MPEMPEVETVRRTLSPLVVGKTIHEVKLWYPKLIVGDANEFASALKGKKILAVDRYAKFLLFRLSDQLTIVSHLRMEGKYRLVNVQDPKDKHDHLQFVFTDQSALRYNDVRKFGRLQLVQTGTEQVVTGISKLGPEALSADFSAEYFVQALKLKKKNLKSVLLDQTVVAGLGNIYVDEVLFTSKIHPLSKPQKIPVPALETLHDVINKTIAEAIELRGTTVHTFLDAAGQTGQYQAHLKAYGHSGQPCPRCGTTLEKIKVDGRGTTFCPNCQVNYQ